jgi:hypothetical protein
MSSGIFVIVTTVKTPQKTAFFSPTNFGQVVYTDYVMRQESDGMLK